MNSRILLCLWRSFRYFSRPVVFIPSAQLATTPHHAQRQFISEIEAEDPHSYSRGLYFPIHLGNKFQDGRYVVFHKLGWGGFATVWLARDVLQNFNVALKIVRKDANAHELDIMRHLRDSPIAKANANHPGRRYVTRLFDDFDVSESHRCLVLEVMGSSVASRAEDYAGERLPAIMAKRVTYQIALGLDYLWKCRIAHGDLYGGNVLFPAPAISTLAEERVQSYFGTPELGAVKCINGESICERSMPRYLVRPKKFLGDDAEIRIIDLGSAFFHDAPPKQLQTPQHTHAPEALYDQSLSHFIDMWSMGCLLFEIVTGRPFIGSVLANRFSTAQGIRSHLGPPPMNWESNLDTATRNRMNDYHPREIRLDRYVSLAYDQDEAALIEDFGDDYPIEECEKSPRELDGAEIDALTTTLSGLLRYDPKSRSTPEALLRSPWFVKAQESE